MEVFEGGLGKLGSFWPHPITCNFSYQLKKNNMQILRDLGVSMLMLVVSLVDMESGWIGYDGWISLDLV